ncbi:hypothetical protein V6Z11_1Z089700 [Gossypium hirsutum]
MSRERERLYEIGKKIKREADVKAHNGFSWNPKYHYTCAACKLLRRRCAEECPFSPYFSPHEPQKFASVHKVFGASNVSKMLMEVPENQRADAASSLVYEANVRLRDPVYGCMGAISALQQQVQSLQAEINAVRAEILKHKCREANLIPSSSHLALLSSGAVSIATPPPMPLPQPTTAADYNTISDENVTYTLDNKYYLDN